MNMSPEIDQLKLTAFALDELEPADRDAVEVLLADDPSARAFVAEVRQTAALLARHLETELDEGLDPTQHLDLEQRLEQAARRPLPLPLPLPRKRSAERWNYAILGFSAAASIFIVGGAIALIVPMLYRRFEINPDARTASRSVPFIIVDQNLSPTTLPAAPSGTDRNFASRKIDPNLPDSSSGANGWQPDGKPLRLANGGYLRRDRAGFRCYGRPIPRHLA